jgi:tetratricopeptide (TPR) repeat protein
MAEDHMLKEAIEAVRLGHKTRARDLLTRLLRADQSNATYWLWMSSVVESSREQAYCLQTALRYDPQNETARRGLVLIGAQPADSNKRPEPFIRRNWKVAVQKEPLQGFLGLWANPVLRSVMIVVVVMIVFGLVLIGFIGFGRKQTSFAARPTRTPGPAPTFTSTPTFIARTLVVEQVTPTIFQSGPTPLWMLLEATYTPTPVYVNTPHPIIEDFRIAQRAFGRGDWENALHYFKNASQIESGSPDIIYLIGESQRMLGDLKAAIDSYNQALKISPNFAPAYLGRVRARLALDKKADIMDDLDRAIELDPAYAEALLERVAYALQRSDVEAAQADLDVAEALIPESPMLRYYQARVALLAGDREAAFKFARQAYDLDRTLLPVYRLLGEVALANGEFSTAKDVLEVYLQYGEDDAEGWMALGQSYMEIAGPEQAYEDLVQAVLKKDVEAALQAFDRALELDDELPGVYLYRAVTYIALGEGQKAVNDLLRARRLDPGSFAINIGLGRALLLAERFEDAQAQIDSCEKFAENDIQLAAVLYWRAIAAEAVGPALAAIRPWEALLEMPEDAYPIAWRRIAEEHLAALTPTPSPSITPTPKPTRTPTSRPTRTPTPKGETVKTDTPEP